MNVPAQPRLNPLMRVPPHIVRPGLLDAGSHAALLDWAVANQASFRPAGVGANPVIRTEARNAMTGRDQLTRPLREMLRERVREELPHWLTALGMTPFDIAAIELDPIAYKDGAFYMRHIDTATRDRDDVVLLPSERLLTAVYYFHGQPKGFAGGELRLYPIQPPPADAPQFIDLPPMDNSVIAFPSWAPHEVRPVACPSGRFEDSRFAINCWVRRMRPGAEADRQ